MKGATTLLLALACGGAEQPPPPVTFVYLASTTLDPEVAQHQVSCLYEVGRTHIHPSWHNFARTYMNVTGDHYTLTFFDAPPGRHSIRVSDPNVCRDNPTGAATRNVFANGVELTDIVDTPGDGVEPGLGFTLKADGTVAP